MWVSVVDEGGDDCWGDAGTAPAAGCRADNGTVGIVGFGERIVAHWDAPLPNPPPLRGRGSAAPKLPLPRSGGGLGRGCGKAELLIL